jgi:adenylate cyclase
VLLAIPAATVVTIGIRELGLLQGLELFAYDQVLQGRPREPIDRRVAIVSITDADLRRFGTTSLSDGVYATAIERLKAMGPRAIGLDIYRDLPQNPGHDRLVRVFKNTPYLIAIAKVQGTNAADRVAPPPALAGTDRVASNDFVADLDGKVRRAFIATIDPNNPDQQVYGLGLYLALLYLNHDGIGPEEVPNEPWAFRLKQAVFRRLHSNDGGYIRTNDAGNQLLLNYRGPRNSFEMASISDLVDGKLPADWARDRVILIGNVSESGRDFFATP